MYSVEKEYSENPELKKYVEKYAVNNSITVEVALTHKIVQLVGEAYYNKRKGIVK